MLVAVRDDFGADPRTMTVVVNFEEVDLPPIQLDLKDIPDEVRMQYINHHAFKELAEWIERNNTPDPMAKSPVEKVSDLSPELCSKSGQKFHENCVYFCVSTMKDLHPPITTGHVVEIMEGVLGFRDCIWVEQEKIKEALFQPLTYTFGIMYHVGYGYAQVDDTMPSGWIRFINPDRANLKPDVPYEICVYCQLFKESYQ